MDRRSTATLLIHRLLDHYVTTCLFVAMFRLFCAKSESLLVTTAGIALKGKSSVGPGQPACSCSRSEVEGESMVFIANEQVRSDRGL